MNQIMYPNNMQPYGRQQNNRSGIVTATIIGALASAAVKTTINVKKVKEGSATQEEAIKDVAKGTLQGAVATATVASMHDALTRPNRSVLSAATYGAMGIVGVYAIEKFSEKLEEPENA